MENRYPPLCCRLLRARRKRPRCRTAKQGDELSPSHRFDLHQLPAAYRGLATAHRIGKK
jgi:hypothetical protein